ncbi:DNA primase [Glutamicibacter soli]|uniref:DNA primase n=1 Tax=Glutamicibacter soli TaxID=453836 RepID=A0A365YL41_9MICC|nr:MULTISPECIES: DNA primase [Micrococcaceae]ALQ31457.1 DNA primase [Arthrobacter sp. YC-RL1]KLI90055.1 DNA primase [Arthrobacter sp. YC-RL1]RBM02734.1 DNA primase [Glutamicibacter soli]
MAGLIKREDIDEVRNRTDLREVVESYVTLKSAGIGSFKGLCPFHDERSPSFHIRPQLGTFHCFGCGESGDVIAFIQKMDHSSFTETVELLAARINYELHYEDGGPGPRREDYGKRQRLVDAHKVAEEFFRAQLETQEGAAAREFLTGRGFDEQAVAHFSVGYAPKGWDGLLKHLRSRGFVDEELKLTGMFSEGNRGIYDRFRGRVMWPIRDLSGATIGFGARKLYEDDQGPKYLNTPETQLYKKSQVLYGLDLAKKQISKGRQIVVVEGYTDVMACHLAGITTAVATCGTAFGTDHIKISRRLLQDDGTGGEVIFTFDGDAAGQKAALRAFEEDQRFIAQTYVCVEPTGADPCDLRLHRGDEAVRELIENKRPLFEFAIRAELKKFNLDTVEGRVQALRQTAPIVAAIRDSAIRPAYARELAGWLGMNNEDVNRSVAASIKRAKLPRNAAAAQPPAHAQDHAPGAQAAPAFERPDSRDPVMRLERQALEVVIQQPQRLADEQWQAFYEARFMAPAHAAVHDGIVAASTAGASAASWVEVIREEVPEQLRSFVSELAVTIIPALDEHNLNRYCSDIINGLIELQITHRKAELIGKLQRAEVDPDGNEYSQINKELMELEMRRRILRGT